MRNITNKTCQHFLRCLTAPTKAPLAGSAKLHFFSLPINLANTRVDVADDDTASTVLKIARDKMTSPPRFDSVSTEPPLNARNPNKRMNVPSAMFYRWDKRQHACVKDKIIGTLNSLFI